jgi:hypothetical protein
MRIIIDFIAARAGRGAIQIDPFASRGQPRAHSVDVFIETRQVRRDGTDRVQTALMAQDDDVGKKPPAGRRLRLAPENEPPVRILHRIGSARKDVVEAIPFSFGGSHVCSPRIVVRASKGKRAGRSFSDLRFHGIRVRGTDWTNDAVALSIIR